MKWLMTCLLLSVISVYSWDSNIPSMRIGYYQEIEKPKSTLCVDTYGRVHLYSGAAIKIPKVPLEGGLYSVCIESKNSTEELEKLFKELEVVVIHPVSRSW